MNNQAIDFYREALETFDRSMNTASVDPAWESQSACEGWTIRDVLGHCYWGIRLLSAHVQCERFDVAQGPPGSLRPGVLVLDQPLSGWRAARSEVMSALTRVDMQDPAPPWLVEQRSDATIHDFLELFALDLVVHAWDAQGSSAQWKSGVSDELARHCYRVGRLVVVRSPSAFGPRVKPPADACVHEKLLAFLGRTVETPTDANAT